MDTENATGTIMPRISKAAGSTARRGLADLAEEPERFGAESDHADAHEPPLVEDLDADDDVEPGEGAQNHDEAEREADDHSGGADDALGLYLRQMGAIPLLTRQQELDLARRLEFARMRFRRAALSSPVILDRVLEMFERVRAGDLNLDPTIDVVTSLNLSRDRIMARMPHNLPTLRRVLTTLAKEFPDAQRVDTVSGRAWWRRRVRRLTRKAIKLVEELSPRTELL